MTIRSRIDAAEDPDFIAGRALLRSGRAEDALERLRFAAGRAPSACGVWTSYAQALAAAGRPRDAKNAFARVAELAPSDAAAWAHYARAAQASGDVASARAAFVRALDCEPEQPGWLAELAELEYASGDLDASARHYRAALKCAPDRSGLRRSLARVEARIRRSPERKGPFLARPGMRRRPRPDDSVRRRVCAELAARGVERVLELGCGTGALRDALRDVAPDVAYAGLDVRVDAVAQARDSRPDAAFYVANISTTDLLGTLAYDAAVAIGTIDALADDIDVLKRVPRGVFVVVVVGDPDLGRAFAAPADVRGRYAPLFEELSVAPLGEAGRAGFLMTGLRV